MTETCADIYTYTAAIDICGVLIKQPKSKNKTKFSDHKNKHSKVLSRVLLKAVKIDIEIIATKM